MVQNDITIRIGGEAGMGLESSGAGFSKALARGGLYVFGVPDYYSRIRGGHNFFSVRIATWLSSSSLSSRNAQPRRSRPTPN